ncbi:MAG TPA: hypothetical protein VK668_21870 [Mucilaginibacter sp.]|nr:hypothetical protein [Mucilaginibacter sp.]
MKNSYQFEFVNSLTGNIIAYLTLSKELDKEQRDQRLESKKAELAVTNKINIALIYWQDHEFALA